MLLGRGLCDDLITRPEESYLLCCDVVCDLETSRMGAPYIYNISRLRVKDMKVLLQCGGGSYDIRVTSQDSSIVCECAYRNIRRLWEI